MTAAYTDGLSPPDKSLVAVSTNSVLAAPADNNPPMFTETNPARSVAENAQANALVGGRVTATDPDVGNTVRYEFDPDDPLDSDLFTIDAGSGQIRVKTQGALDYETQPMPTVKVKASDSSNASATVVVTIDVMDVNEPPRAASLAETVLEDGTVDIDVIRHAFDEDAGDTLTVAGVVRSPGKGGTTVNDVTNDITYKPHANYHGADSFTYRVNDARTLLSNIATVTITVMAVNDAPRFASPPPALRVSESAEAGDVVGAVTASDVDGDQLTYSLSGADASSFDIDSNGQITVSNAAMFDIGTQATYEVEVEADDGTDTATDTATVRSRSRS